MRATAMTRRCCCPPESASGCRSANGARSSDAITAPVGPGTHGPVIARSGDAVHSTTADGVDGASISGRVLTNPRSVAYSPTRSIVQNYRPRSRLVRFPDGVAGRFAISAPYGAVTTIHPDGDALTLLDTRRGSATYGRVVGKVTSPLLILTGAWRTSARAETGRSSSWT